MKLAILIGAVLFAALAVPVAAAKPTPSGTIAIADGHTAALGDPLLFDVTMTDLPGWANPQIHARCFQDVNLNGLSFTEDLDANAVPDDLVYGEMTSPEVGVGGQYQPFDPFGGATTPWAENGGPAACDAALLYYDHHGVPHVLATVVFGAAG